MVQIATGYRAPDTLLSDTEESVVGTQWHQEAISGLADLLRAVADQRGERWGVCEQIALQGLWHEDGSPYEPRPDVLVLATPLVSGDLASVPLAAVGAPLFIAEVVSRSTRANDLGDKRQAYAAIGAREYLIFDPSGHLLPTPVQAWRLGPEGGPYIPWTPDRQGWGHSAALQVALRPTPPLLSVRDRDSTPIEPSLESRRLRRAAERARDEEALRRREAEQAQAAAERAQATAEQAQAQEARHRVEAERAQAAAEQARAALEEELRRLREGLPPPA